MREFPATRLWGSVAIDRRRDLFVCLRNSAAAVQVTASADLRALAGVAEETIA
jgi:hypothetical protein